jgi:alkylation response protein AidB-like acyl-CoA dehydrogenase
MSAAGLAAAALPDDPAAALLERVRALLPALRARNEEVERAGTLPPDLMHALAQAGCFRILEPACFGGRELSFATLAEVTMTLGTACSSSAWLTCVLNGWWMLGGFPERAQREVADERPAAVVGAVFAPTTDVTPVPGGFRIGGRWPFASGIDLMDYVLLGGFVADGARPLDVRLFLVPRREVTALDDWDALGLRGTGSKTALVDRVFVPEHRTLSLAQLREGAAPGASLHRSPLYRVPFGAIFPVLLATPAVGVAAGALDQWVAWARAHLSRGTFRAAEYVPLQVRLGEAAAQIDSARLLLQRHLVGIEDQAAGGRPPDAQARAVCWRDGAYAANLCRRAIQSLFEATGATAVSSRSPLQRSLRDLQTMSAHISLRWDEAGERFGRATLGFEPPNAFFY